MIASYVEAMTPSKIIVWEDVMLERTRVKARTSRSPRSHRNLLAKVVALRMVVPK